MTGPRDPQTRREFFAAAGGETLVEQTTPGAVFTLTGLPVPDGTVRVFLAVDTEAGPFGVQVVVTADQARRMGELLTRVAAR